MHREKVMRFISNLASLILGNTRLLDNKEDELTALVRKENIFDNCNLMSFTEIQLPDSILDSTVTIDQGSSTKSPGDSPV